MNNEKGIALVTVLLTIVVTMVLLGTLASIILSTGAQTQRSQENIQADSLAMMGQEYITSSFKSVKDDASSQAGEDESISMIIQQWAYNHSITERNLGEGKYVVTLENVEGDSLTYTYEAKGIVKDQEEVITGFLSINEEVVEDDWEDRIINEKDDLIDSLSGSDPTNICTSSEDNEFEGEDYLIKDLECKGAIKNDTEFEIGSRVWFKDSLVMKGHSTIIINGFTYFQVSKLSMNGGNEIIIKGDAFISTEGFNSDKMTKNTEISIYGNAYFENTEASVIRDLNICVTGNTNVDNISACKEG